MQSVVVIIQLCDILSFIMNAIEVHNKRRISYERDETIVVHNSQSFEECIYTASYILNSLHHTWFFWAGSALLVTREVFVSLASMLHYTALKRVVGVVAEFRPKILRSLFYDDIIVTN